MNFTRGEVGNLNSIKLPMVSRTCRAAASRASCAVRRKSWRTAISSRATAAGPCRRSGACSASRRGRSRRTKTSWRSESGRDGSAGSPRARQISRRTWTRCLTPTSTSSKKLKKSVLGADHPLRALMQQRKLHVRGALEFWDVIPQIAGTKLAVEIMTPHYSHYYQDRPHAGSKSPHDSGQPTPISFLTIPPDTEFTFHVRCDRRRLSRLHAGPDPERSLASAFEISLLARLRMAWLRREDSGRLRRR